MSTHHVFNGLEERFGVSRVIAFNNNTEIQVNIPGSLMSMSTHVFVCIMQRCLNKRKCLLFRQFPAGSCDMPQPQYCISTHIEVRMIRQRCANILGPDATHVGSIHPNNDRYIKQFLDLTAFHHGNDIIFCPSIFKWPHILAHLSLGKAREQDCSDHNRPAQPLRARGHDARGDGDQHGSHRHQVHEQSRARRAEARDTRVPENIG